MFLFHRFEKMISGMYMGEVARQVIVRLVAEGLLFDGKSSDILQEKGSFFTKYISEIERYFYLQLNIMKKKSPNILSMSSERLVILY